MKTYLLDLNLEQLENWVKALGEKRFRARQIWRWLYVHLADDFAAMTSLSKDLRERLDREATCTALTMVEETASSDGLTHKALFELPDGERIETVLMFYDFESNSAATPTAGRYERATVCVSTQVGCAIGCPFCATGQGGFRRNLSAGEIVEQVLYYARWLERNRPIEERPGEEQRHRVTNVVFMGMGEPFANFAATWKTVEFLHHPDGLNMGARRMTISTAGLAPGILRMAEEELQVNLAVSLHAATDELRDELVPVNRSYPLHELMRAVRAYIKRTNRRVTFEYVLIKGVNDALVQAHRLAERLEGMLCHVNLIPFNPIPGSGWQPADPATVAAFQRILAQSNIPVNVREERGLEIAAACGQLRAHAKR
jgi:23S rRNA (adenine2503-C2)-methyltransferase